MERQFFDVVAVINDQVGRAVDTFCKQRMDDQSGEQQQAEIERAFPFLSPPHSRAPRKTSVYTVSMTMGCRNAHNIPRVDPRYRLAISRLVN